jgi:hypothetical protein
MCQSLIPCELSKVALFHAEKLGTDEPDLPDGSIFGTCESTAGWFS